MQASENIVVTYHYVRPQNSDGVTGITPEGFHRQVTALAERYRVLPLAEFAARRHREAGLALITFDDGLADQFEHAAPVLAELGLPAVFYAPMRPFAGVRDGWCTQHLLHALAERLGWEELEARVDAALIAQPPLDQREIDRLYHYETPRKRRLKYLLAFGLAAADAARVLREINASVGLDHRSWFMSVDHLRELRAQGHAIGAHGFEHVPYTTLTPERQRADALLAHDRLTDLLGEPPTSIAFPFGRRDEHTDQIARDLGYDPAFTTEERIDAMDLPRLFATAAAPERSAA